MTTGTKIVIGTAAVLGITALFAFNKKSKAAVKKFFGTIVAGVSSSDTPDDADLQLGSGDVQHVLQLQGFLNELHTAVKHINGKCGITWPVYTGTMPGVSGVFDNATESAMTFYLGRKTIDLDYLNMIRTKMAKYQAGDKCKYPLSY